MTGVGLAAILAVVAVALVALVLLLRKAGFPVAEEQLRLDRERRRAEERLLEKQHRAVMADAMSKLLAGQERLLKAQEPTEEQVREWLRKRGMGAMTPDSAAAFCAANGWVLIRHEQWKQLCEAMTKRGMTVQEWIERGGGE